MQTFAVSDVAPSTEPLEAITRERALAERLAVPFRDDDGDGTVRWREVPIEASGANRVYLVRAPGGAPTHPLIEAVHTAFAHHYPLTLSPDDVWLCLAQGFAMHVEANAESLRARFVRHQGQLVLRVDRHGFVKGSPDNDWQGCFADWSDAIASHIGKQRDLVVASFSTTGPIERAASELVLMSSMRRYFQFLAMTLCGIPSVTLQGTVEDWRAIRRRAEVLAEYNLGPWIAALLPVLDQLVAAAAGRADRAFWRSMYKQNDESGGPYVTGWINVLFPYLRRNKPNPYALGWSRKQASPFDGARLESFPRGLSYVPLTWDYLGTKLSMTLGGGLVGVSQDPATLAVSPAIGWAIWEDARPTNEME